MGQDVVIETWKSGEREFWVGVIHKCKNNRVKLGMGKWFYWRDLKKVYLVKKLLRKKRHFGFDHTFSFCGMTATVLAPNRYVGAAIVFDQCDEHSGMQLYHQGYTLVSSGKRKKKAPAYIGKYKNLSEITGKRR